MANSATTERFLTNLNEMYNKIVTDLNQYKQLYVQKSFESDNFNVPFKTRHSTNITLEDWNALVQHLSDLNSDTQSQNLYLTNLAKVVETIQATLVEFANNYYTRDQVYTKGETYHKDRLYTKDEVYNRNQTYAKSEVYSKNETYSKSEVYNKNETYKKSETYSREEALALGLINITDYNLETGEIEITYNSEALELDYDSETGELIVTYI